MDANGKYLLHDPVIRAHRRGIISAEWNYDLDGRCTMSAGSRPALNQPGHKLPQLSHIVGAKLHFVDDQIRLGLR